MNRAFYAIAASLTMTGALAVQPAVYGHDALVQGGDTGQPTAQNTEPDVGPLHAIEFSTDEGTWMNLDVSPDGRTILFDLLGDIYTLPIEGGEAALLLGGRDWDLTPRYSPDGESIAFISDRDGNMNLWTMDADGGNLKQHTDEYRYPSMSPVWAPDGSILVCRTARNARGIGTELWTIYPDGGSGIKIPLPGDVTGPAISGDGRFIYTAEPSLSMDQPFRSVLRRLDRLTAASVQLGPGVRPRVSPDGRYLAYARDNDHLTALHVRDLGSGADRRLIASITPMATGYYAEQDRMPDYAFTPDGQSIIISIEGKIVRVDVETGATRAIPFHARVSQRVAEPIRVDRALEDGDLQVKVLRWPSLSPDGSQIVFSALGKLFTVDITGGQPRRLTSSDEREYTPAFSPDGRWIAYTTWSDTRLGHLKVVSAEGGEPRRLTTVPGRYANPAWSRDGSKLAFSRGAGIEQRRGQPEEETFFDLLWVPLSGEEPNYVTSVARYTGFTMRLYPVIALSPDGTRIFYSERVRRDFAQSPPTITTLYSVRLDGTDKVGHLRFVPVEEVLPSPDGRQVAFVHREQIIVAALPPYPTTVVDLDFENPAVPLKKLTIRGGNYVAWHGADTVTWGFVNRIYSQQLDAEESEQLAEVRLVVPRARPEGKIAFTNARIITMVGDEVIDDGSIVVDGNRIVSIGPSSSVQVPPDALVVDASGKTIMPGLVDVHDHMHYSGLETFPQQKWEYVANLAYGITTAFDPSAHNLNVFAQQEMLEAGEMLGPRLYSTGDVIYGNEEVFPVVYENIRSIEDARNVVKRFKPYDPVMLKEYRQPRRDQRQWLVQAAREEGIMLTAEGGTELVLDLTLIADGYSAFEHALSTGPLYGDVIEFVARSKVHYTPTLIVPMAGPSLEHYFASRHDIHDDAKLRRFTPEDELDPWRRWQHIPEGELYALSISEAAARISKRGGYVTVGAHGNRHGIGTHWELWGLQMGGLTNLEALRAGTYFAALKIGYERDFGSLEPGKSADLLVLHANPLEDIRNTVSIQYVVKNGFVWDAESMTQLYPERKKLARFFWQTDEDLEQFAAPEPRQLSERSGAR